MVNYVCASKLTFCCSDSFQDVLVLLHYVIDLEGQGHFFFLMCDYVGVHVRINSATNSVRYHDFGAFALLP